MKYVFFLELDDFLQELDEDVEGMQSTILFLQQELKLAKETITNLERENYLLKNGNGASGSGNNRACSNNGTSECIHVFSADFKHSRFIGKLSQNSTKNKKLTKKMFSPLFRT